MASAPQDPTVQCPHCDSYTSVVMSHCKYCGNDLSQEPAPTGPGIFKTDDDDANSHGFNIDYDGGVLPGYRSLNGSGLSELFSAAGRYGRKDFWITILGLFVVNVGLRFFIGVAVAITFGRGGNEVVAIGKLLALPVSIVISWMTICTHIKRWHDLDKSGWWWLINLIPCAGWIYSFVMVGCTKGTTGRNKFGSDPLRR